MTREAHSYEYVTGGAFLLSRVAFVVGLNKNGLSKKTSKKTDN